MLARLMNMFAVHSGHVALKQVNTDLQHIQQHSLNISTTLVALRTENNTLRTENEELRKELNHLHEYNASLVKTNKSLVKEGTLMRAQIRNLERWLRAGTKS